MKQISLPCLAKQLPLPLERILTKIEKTRKLFDVFYYSFMIFCKKVIFILKYTRKLLYFLPKASKSMKVGLCPTLIDFEALDKTHRSFLLYF